MMKLRRLALLVSTLASLAPSATWADGGFNDNDTIDTLHPSWMSWIPDHVRLSQLSVPATHDTMALYGPSWDFLTLGIAGDITQTQSLPLLSQLFAGIRGLDIRGQLEEDGTLEIYHGEIYQHTNFGEVLAICNLFLDIFPSETIFMWMGENGTEVPDDPPISYEDAVYAYLNDPVLGRYVARETDIPKDNKNPTVGEMRGKIIMIPMQAWGPDIPDFYALNGDNNIDFEDNGTDAVNSLFDVDGKREAVLDHCFTANNDTSTALYRNTVAGGGALFPYSTANNVNPALTRLLFSQNFSRKVGFINMDFPGAALIDAIIAHNLRFGPDLRAMKNDLDHIIDNLSQCLNDIGKDSASERATHLRAYFRDKTPGHAWSVVSCGTQGGDNWGFAIGHPGFSTITPWDGGYRELVFSTPALSGFVSHNQLNSYLSNSLLLGLGGNAHNRAQQLKSLLDNQFPGMGWNVVVKKAPVNDNTFSHDLEASVVVERVLSDDGEIYKYVVFAVSALDSPPVAAPLVVDTFLEGTVGAVLDARQSYDPDGKSLLFRWDTDGDGGWDTPWEKITTAKADLLDDPAPKIQLQITDGRHTVTVFPEIKVNNVLPTIDVGGPITVFTGEPVSRQGAFTDPGLDVWKVKVNYGDGSGPVQIQHTNKQFLLSHTYSSAGTYNVEVTVEDDDTSTTTTLQVTVTDPGPPRILSFERTPVGSIAEGTTVNFSGEFFFPDYNIFGGYLVLHPDERDLSISRNLRPSVQNIGTHRYRFSGSYTYTNNRSDGAPYEALLLMQTSGFGPGSQGRLLPVPVTNVGPTLDPISPIRGGEGELKWLVARFTDPGEDSWTYTINFGDGHELTIPNAELSLAQSHRYGDAGTYTGTVTVTDSDGLSDTESFTATITDRPLLSLDFLEAGNTDEGGKIRFFGVITAESSADPVSAIIDWGDGSPETEATINRGAVAGFVADHIYRDDNADGQYTLTVTVRDAEGNELTGQTTSQVSNVAPEITLGLDALVPSNRLFRHNVAFSDPGADQWTARVNFGDGSGWSDLGAVGISFPIEHAYPADGLYTVQVEVTDDDGGSQTASMRVLVGLPRLEVLPSAPGWVELRWPILPFPFRLERSTNLMPGQWEEVPDEPQPLNGNNLLPREIHPDREFFRLAYP